MIKTWLKPTFLAVMALLAALALPGGASAQTQDPTTGPQIFLPLVMSAPPPPANPIHTGEGTYYSEANGGGNCMFDPTPNDLNVAAMNAVDYNNAAVCGEYVHIWGPKGEVTVRIVDQCPECKSGDLDLSPQAFDQIADLPQGRVKISWQLVSPAIAGPIAYHIHKDSNPWWLSVQVRNHRNPVAKFEYRSSGGQWVTVPRQSYNYFEISNLGTGPFTFRVTDAYGNVLTDSGIPFKAGTTFNGSAQFPPGP